MCPFNVSACISVSASSIEPHRVGVVRNEEPHVNESVLKPGNEKSLSVSPYFDSAHVRLRRLYFIGCIVAGGNCQRKVISAGEAVRYGSRPLWPLASRPGCGHSMICCLRQDLPPQSLRGFFVRW